MGGKSVGEEASRDEPPPPSLTYVSLGDSLAVGVGASEPKEYGYAPLYRTGLERATGRKTRLLQLGVSGETSRSFFRHRGGRAAQAERARTALRRNPGAVVTLSLGGNDLLEVASASDVDRRAAVHRYGRNLDRALRQLSGASDPEPEITVLGLYNPFPNGFTDGWVGALNDEIAAAARENGAAFAPADRAFRSREEEYIRQNDIHPTDEGYRVLARVLAEANDGSRAR